VTTYTDQFNDLNDVSDLNDLNDLNVRRVTSKDFLLSLSICYSPFFNFFAIIQHYLLQYEPHI